MKRGSKNKRDLGSELVKELAPIVTVCSLKHKTEIEAHRGGSQGSEKTGWLSSKPIHTPNPA